MTRVRCDCPRRTESNLLRLPAPLPLRPPLPPALGFPRLHLYLQSRPGRGPTFGEKAAVYRSPGSSGSLAALMRAERGVGKPGAGGKKIGRAEASKANEAYIPGMAPPEANKPSKNARKQVRCSDGGWYGRGFVPLFGCFLFWLMAAGGPQPLHQPLHQVLHQPLQSIIASTIATNHCTNHCINNYINHCINYCINNYINHCINHCYQQWHQVLYQPLYRPLHSTIASTIAINHYINHCINLCINHCNQPLH